MTTRAAVCGVVLLAHAALGVSVGSRVPGATEAADALKQYQDTFYASALHGLGVYVAGYTRRSLPPGTPAHRVEVLRTQLGYALVTSGVGLVASPAFELVTYSAQEGAQIADVLSTIVSEAFAAPGRTPHPWSTITLTRATYGLRRFAVLPAGSVEIGARDVTLLEIFPLEQRELVPNASGKAVQDWAVRHPPEVRQTRWLSALKRSRP